MRGRHGGARVGASGAAREGAENTDTGRVDIEQSAVVGEARDSVAGIGRTNGAGGLGGRRRDAGDVDGVAKDIAVAGSDSEEDAGRSEGVSGVIHGLREPAAERHVDNDSVGAISAGGIIDNVIHAGNDIGAARDVS